VRSDSSTEETELEALLDRVPVLRGLPRTVTELSGGLTNRNLRVTNDRGDFVVRCFRGDTDLLDIDRDAEHHNVGTYVDEVAGLRTLRVSLEGERLVIDYIDGVTYDNDSFAKPGVLERAAHALRTLHQGPRFQSDFDMFRRQARYLRTVREKGFRLYDGYVDHDDAFHRVERALGAPAEPTVPCNNDLLAGNFVDDGEKVWLIDYEYSGNNDACFEIGNTCTECDLDEDQVEAMVTAYFGRPSRAKLARVRLQMLVSAYGWSLWGAIQSGASQIDYDFDSWGQERFDKAARGFTSSRFEQLLEDAARAD